jgi:succinate dehydrogenase / fumarate reductase membrane anchor subunit
MGSGTQIGKVRGLGSARTGSHHWWLQRLTAGSNLALMIWFLVSLARLPALDHATVTSWLGNPMAAVPLMLLIVSVFWHFRLGLQVVIEDYQHDESRVVMMIALNFFTIGAAALAIFSILKIAFSGTPT